MVSKRDLKYEIIMTIGVISEKTKGWRRELNLISWNDAEPKYDIRDWAPDHEKMGKGITLTEEELLNLVDLAKKRVMTNLDPDSVGVFDDEFWTQDK